MGTGARARSLCTAGHAVRGTSVATPLVGDEVGEVVLEGKRGLKISISRQTEIVSDLEEHAGRGGVAPVVHLTAPAHVSSIPNVITYI